MDLTGLPPRVERARDLALDRVPMVVGVGLALCFSIPGLPWHLPLAPLLLFFHPMVFGPWWILRFAPRMRMLARVPLREDLWLASVHPWAYTERELRAPLDRLLHGFAMPVVAWAGGTLLWLFVQAIPVAGSVWAAGNGFELLGMLLGGLAFGSVLVAEQMVAYQVVRMTAWEMLERMTAPGKASRTADFHALVRCLVLIVGPFAFVILWGVFGLFIGAWTGGVGGGLGGLLFIPFCFWCAWRLGVRADAARERAVAGYFRFE